MKYQILLQIAIRYHMLKCQKHNHRHGKNKWQKVQNDNQVFMPIYKHGLPHLPKKHLRNSQSQPFVMQYNR